MSNRERPLSPRETEIISLVAQGYTNKAIAEELSISEQTVRNHLSSVFFKLGVTDRFELALYAVTKETLGRELERPTTLRMLDHMPNHKTSLSPRERKIIGLVAQARKNREIAEELSISEQTVKNHLHSVFFKLGVTDRLELALYAIHKNLLPEDVPPAHRK